MKRRDFLKKAGVGVAAAATTTIGAPAVIAKKHYRWKMVTTWPPKLPVLQDGAERLAKRIDELSDGRLKIEVFAGGELVPPFGTFDAVSAGTVEAGCSASYYWAGKMPASQWFAAVPFGLNGQGMAAWFHGGNALKLWEETYAPFNVIPRPGGSTGVQMGGWFNKKINTLDDYKGLKMRIPGLGGKVVARAGGTVVLAPGGEIFTNLERGVIDATEWVGPLHDLRMGFYQAAKYYYYPGWHEPTACLEGIVNKTAYDALEDDLQQIVKIACMAANQNMLSDFTAKNKTALDTLINQHKVQLRKYPDDVLEELKGHAQAVFDELGEKSAMGKKIYLSYKAFAEQTRSWLDISENAYFKAR